MDQENLNSLSTAHINGSFTPLVRLLERCTCLRLSSSELLNYNSVHRLKGF